MERFGRPRFRGAATAAKPYGTRPGPKRSGPMGARAPSHQAPGRYSSYQSDDFDGWQPSRANSAGPRFGGVQSKDNRFNQRSSFGPSGPSWQQENKPIPPEIRQLMQSFDLSQDDMEELSKLPEHELSVNNLARVIGNMRQEKQAHGRRLPSGMYRSPDPTPFSDHHDSYDRRDFPDDSEDRNQNDGRFRASPRRGSLVPRPDRFGNRPSTPEHFRPANRHKLTGIKVTVKPTDQFHDNMSGFPKPGGRHDFVHGNRNDEYYQEEQIYGRNTFPDRRDQSRNDSFPTDNRRINKPNLASRELQSNQLKFGNLRRVEQRNDRAAQQTPRGVLPKPMGTRNIPKASTLPSLLDRSPRGGESRLLRGPVERNTHGLENLVAAVSGNSAASLLTPLVLATQGDPTVLEAQIQAMKTLQQQLKLKQQSPFAEERERGLPPPPRRRRSPPLSRAALIDRKLEEEARKEAQHMRSMRGKVLYIKYKSPRILESDLKQLASAFGRVTKLLIIKPKVKNGHFQAFMELEQWDCAAAMLEHYMAKPANIKGYPVDVKRSDYVNLQFRAKQLQGMKRRRSKSPIRPNINRVVPLPPKRGRRSLDNKPKLSITTSKSDRRVVASAAENKKGKATAKAKKTDAREILNRSRSRKEKEKIEAEKRHSGSREKSSDRNDSTEKKDDVTEAEKQADDKNVRSTEAESKDEMKNDVEDGEKQDNKEPEKKPEDVFDPLDAIANELALNDEFVLMDEDQGAKSSQEEEKKHPGNDLEQDLDLEDVRVEINQEEEDADRIAKDDSMDSGSADVEQENPLLVVQQLIDDILQEVQIQMDEFAPSLDESMEDLPSQDGDHDLSADSVQAVGEEDNTAEHPDSVQAVGEEDNTVEHPDASYDEEAGIETLRISELESVIGDCLREVVCAKEHLDALVKVTKAKAAQSIAKKLRVCLDVAIARLDNVSST